MSVAVKSKIVLRYPSILTRLLNTLYQCFAVSLRATCTKQRLHNFIFKPEFTSSAGHFCQLLPWLAR